MKNTIIALTKYWTGSVPSVSSFIDGETLTMGYGKLNHMGEFEYPLPDFIVRKEFGGSINWEDLKETAVWKSYMKES